MRFLSLSRVRKIQRRSSARGFTLIELMITVAVVAILASLAVPAFRQYSERARRTEAQSRMLDIALQLERTYTLTGAYPAGLPAATDASVPIGAAPSVRTYLITYGSAGATYAMTATPQNSQVNDSCGSFGLTEANVRSVSGPFTLAQCWTP